MSFVTPEPPALETNPSLAGGPGDIPHPPVVERPGRVNLLLHEADSHYQAGRRLYQEGNADSARREFDLAIDVLLGAPDTAAFRAPIEQKLDELVAAIHRLDLAGLGSGNIAEPAFDKPPLEDIPEMTFRVDPRLKDKVLEEVRATASQLPLQVNDAVLGYIHYFSSERGRRLLISGLRRAGRYRPMIQRVFDEEGVPQELIFLAQAESGFFPRAVSRKAATGMWQFMRSRGREYGLTQTPYIDDRLDPEKATRAAARHLRDLYHHYGDWYLAMAAYNCGPGVVDRAVERTGYADFWELRRRSVLPRDTTSYVPVILAMTIMTKNPDEYALNDIDPDPPLSYDLVEITAQTSLLLLADAAECPVSQLQELNPALLKNVVPPGTMVRTPKGTGTTIAAVLDAVPGDRRSSWRVHRVEDGEDLASIARRYRVSEASLATANRGENNILERGDILIIPAAPQPEIKVVSKRSRGRAARSGIRRASVSHARSHTHARAARAPSRRSTGGRALESKRRPVAHTALNLTRAKKHVSR